MNNLPKVIKELEGKLWRIEQESEQAVTRAAEMIEQKDVTIEELEAKQVETIRIIQKLLRRLWVNLPKVIKELKQRIAELEATQVETIRIIKSNCYDGCGQSNDRLLAHAKKLKGQGK